MSYLSSGSKRLQLEWGGCATPLSLLDLLSRDAISIPTAPTKSSDDSIDLRSPTLGLGNGVGILWWHGVLFSVLPLVRSQYSNYGIRDYSRVAVGRSPVFLFVARVPGEL